MTFALILADEFTGAVNQLLQGIGDDLKLVGAAALMLGIIVGGLLRIFAYGNERRVAMSNVALSCAVVGFIIIMLSTAINLSLQHFLPKN